MKKLLFAILIGLMVMGLAALSPRSYTQLIVNDSDGKLVPGITNNSMSSSPDYLFSAYITKRPAEVISTATHPANSIRIFRLGNGTTFPYVTCAYFQFGAFYAPWAAGDTIRFNLKHIASGDSISWDLVIPDDNTSAIGFKQKFDPIESIAVPPWTLKESKAEANKGDILVPVVPKK